MSPTFVVWFHKGLCSLTNRQDWPHLLDPVFVHLLSWHFLKQVVNHMQRLSDVVWPSFAPLRSSFFCSNFKIASSEVWWCKFLFWTASNICTVHSWLSQTLQSTAIYPKTHPHPNVFLSKLSLSISFFILFLFRNFISFSESFRYFWVSIPWRLF